MAGKSSLASLNEDGSLTLYPSKLSAIGLLLGCVAFVVIGIHLGMTEGIFGYFAAAFFGLGIPIAIVQLIPGSTYLRIDNDGLTLCNMFRETKIPWDIIDRFGVATIKTESSTTKMVGINFTSSYKKAKAMRRISAAISGFDGGLPSNYGMKVEELADLLNECLHNFKPPN